ncbi:Uu.00g091010.m01.CDS01 [Anthostomella pinea]|uniref:Uu.00g091010.m01.CDS01 n=1 Tax=Anthostomella pinea TaxID=933095 RepID=A0AAI8VP68_9PEZI|nr:Uu.00g091010.m01.CDS01 [Anthostomella pinea]
MSPAKSILVTGCSADGIGAAIALALARRGHHVFATARNPAKIPESLSSLTNVTVLPLDVADAASVAAAARAVADAGRGLDVLVNNAGVERMQPAIDVDIAVAQRMMDMIQAFADLLITSRGRIVNVSSSASLIYSPWNSTYAASKAGLNALSETLRLELAPFGVSVVTILPGIIDSQIRVNGAVSFDLSPTSRYAPIKDTITGWATGDAVPKDRLSVDGFAELVMSDVLGADKGGIVSRGPYALLLRRIGQWAPTWIADRILSLNTGLDELLREVSKGKSTRASE